MKIIIYEFGLKNIQNSYKNDFTFVVVNISGTNESVSVNLELSDELAGNTLFDNFSGEKYLLGKNQTLDLNLKPFQRFWLKREIVKIPKEKLA